MKAIAVADWVAAAGKHRSIQPGTGLPSIALSTAIFSGMGASNASGTAKTSSANSAATAIR